MTFWAISFCSEVAEFLHVDFSIVKQHCPVFFAGFHFVFEKNEAKKSSSLFLETKSEIIKVASLILI